MLTSGASLGIDRDALIPISKHDEKKVCLTSQHVSFLPLIFSRGVRDASPFDENTEEVEVRLPISVFVSSNV